MLQVGNRTIPSGSLADAIMQLGFHLTADDSAQFRQAAHQAQDRGEALRKALLASGCSPLDMTAFHSFQDDINAAIVDAATTQRDSDAIDWTALDVDDSISKTVAFQDRDQELRRKIHALIARADDIESDLLKSVQMQAAAPTKSDPAAGSKLSDMSTKVTGPDAHDDGFGKEGPVPKPDGWTKSELVSQARDAAGSFSNTTFDNIRNKADVAPSERGGGGQQRRFSRAELRKLIAAIEDGNFRKKAEIAASWGELLAQ